jgi:hypothetical protein
LCKFGFTNTAKNDKNDKNGKNVAKFPKNGRVFTAMLNFHKNEKNNQNSVLFIAKSILTWK